MPSEKTLKRKQDIVDALAEKMKGASAGVLVEYKGINVENDTKLRAELRAAGVDYSVVKNTLTLLAAKKIGFDALEPVLKGTTALAVSTTDDVISPAKILYEYAKKHDKFKIKSGFLEGSIVSVEQIQALAELPSKETLVAQVLYGFNYLIMQLAIALNAISEKTENQEESVASLAVAAGAE